MLDSPPAAPTPLQTTLRAIARTCGGRIPAEDGAFVFTALGKQFGLPAYEVAEEARRLELYSPSPARFVRKPRRAALLEEEPEEWGRLLKNRRDL